MLRRAGFLRAVANIALPAVLVLTCAPFARAAEKDDAATIAAVDKIMSTDVPAANFGEAKKKLRALVDKCKKGCSAQAVGRVYVALGLVAAQINQQEEAKTAWFDALSVDPSAALPEKNVTPAVRQQFDDVKKAYLAANPGKEKDDNSKGGWINKQGYELSKQAIEAEGQQNYADCIEKDKNALTLEENVRARMHLALCEEKSGKLVDSLRDNAKALESARKSGDSVDAKIIQERVTATLPRLAHVRFERPAEVTDLQVTFDDRQIPEARLSESFTIDPGTHNVHAEGTLRGARVSSDDKFDVKDSEITTVKIKLKPASLTKGQLECMVSAKTQEEILACLPQDKKPLQVTIGLETSGYTDTTHVDVLSPEIRASIASPTGGWNVGGTYLVDVVSAASPDVVASASRHFQDVRHNVALTGGYKPGRFGAQAFGNYSTESDYTSRTLGIDFTGDFFEKQATPQVGYSYRWDTIGRSGTDTDVFGRPFHIHEVDLGSTFILSPVSVLVLGAEADFEGGDQSKPYRYIPIFEPGVSVPAGASPEEVNRARLPAKPLEQLPTDRIRLSLGGRYIRRIRGSRTLRLEERVYRDTWAITATSTDARYLIDVNSRLRVWPHLRVHAQLGAKFYSRIYGATLNSDGSATVPEFRTNDRELSPMFGVTGGGGIRYALTDPSGKFRLYAYSSADALFNYYLNTLYIRTRLAGYGTLGLEAEFE